MCKGGAGQTSSATTTQISEPNPQILSDYQNVLNRATTVANQPLQQYGGPLVAGFTPMQQSAFNTVDASQGIANPYINAASQYVSSGSQPITPMAFSPGSGGAGDVNTYLNPFTKDVVDATQAQFNNQNAQQQQQVIGNAISKGAWGGDRAGIAQAELANQQQLAQAPVIAGLRNQGYSQALGEFNTQQQANIGAQEASGWLGENAGFAMGNLGQEAQSTALTGASSELQSGALQQQLGQEQLNIPYEEFLQQQAYPFQTAGWLSNITEGIGGQSGGQASTTTPGPSTASQVGGMGLTGLGILGMSGFFNNGGMKRGGRIGYDGGGAIAPYYDFSYMPAMHDIPQFDVSIVGSPPPVPQGKGPPQPTPFSNGAGPNGGAGGMGFMPGLAQMLGNRSLGNRSSSPTSVGGGGGSLASAPEDIVGNQAGDVGIGSTFGEAGTSMAGDALASDGGMSFADLFGAGMSAMQRGGRTGYTIGGGIPGENFGQNDPNQHNPWTGDVGNVIGTLIGDYFGGPAAGVAGGVVGRTAGLGWGNVFDGKDAYNGKKGNLLDNLNPFSDYGMASLKQAAVGQGSPWGMMGFKLNRGGRAGYAAGGSGPVAGGSLIAGKTTGSRGIDIPVLRTDMGGLPNVNTTAPSITPPPPSLFTNPSYALPSGEITPLSGPLGVPIPGTQDNTAIPLIGGTLALGGLGLANKYGLLSGNSGGGGSEVLAKRGGRIGYDIGGPIMSAGAGMSGMPAGAGNPMMGGLYQQFGQMPPEKLQELSMRVPPNTAQGQVLRRALMAARMKPGAGGQPMPGAPQAGPAPQAAQAPMATPGPQAAPPPTAMPQQPQQPTPMMRSGGRAGYDDGGDVDWGSGYLIPPTPPRASPPPDYEPIKEPRSYEGMTPAQRDVNIIGRTTEGGERGAPDALGYASKFLMNNKLRPDEQRAIAHERQAWHDYFNQPIGPDPFEPNYTDTAPSDESGARAAPLQEGNSGIRNAAGMSGAAMADEPDVPPQGMGMGAYPPPPARKPAQPQQARRAVEDDEALPQPPPQKPTSPSGQPSPTPDRGTAPFKSAYPSRSPWELAVAAGAGMLSSRSPFAGVALGEGLNEGLKYMQKGREDEVGQYKAENEAKRFSQELSNHKQQLDIESKRQAATETHYQDELHHWKALEQQGKYQLTPGYGRDPDSGEPIPGAYRFNGKNGSYEFLPGVVPTAKQGNPQLTYAHLVNTQLEHLRKMEADRARTDPSYKPRDEAALRQDAEGYASKQMPAGFTPRDTGASPAAAAVDWSKVQRPSSVPGNAQYSPSQKSWWWQENGQWKSAPGG